MFRLKLRAKDTGQGPYFLRHKEVVLHESFHGARSAVVGVAHQGRDLLLQIKGQSLFGAGCQIVKLTAQGPEEVERLGEAPDLGPGEDAALHEPRNLLDPIDELGEPEERMEIAKAALAFLDVGFQHIARAPAVKLVAPVSLSQLGFDEGSGAAFLHLPTEAPSQLHKKRLITPEIAAFQQTGGN